MARPCAEEISPAPLPPEPWIQGSMDPCFHADYDKFAPTSLVSPLMCQQDIFSPRELTLA